MKRGVSSVSIPKTLYASSRKRRERLEEDELAARGRSDESTRVATLVAHALSSSLDQAIARHG